MASDPRPFGPGRRTTVVSTQTVTETSSPSLTTSSISTTSDSSTTTPTFSSSSSSSSPTPSSSSSSPPSSSPRSLPLGAIIGGVVAALALILLFIFLLLLLKRRSSQKKSRSSAEIDPPVIPRIDTREDLRRYDSFNDGSGSSVSPLSPIYFSPAHSPQRARSAQSASIPQLRGKLSTRTTHSNYTILSPVRGGGIPLEYTSHPEVHPSLPSTSDHDLITSGATGEESPHTPAYILNQDSNASHRDSNGSDHSHRTMDSAPPAYSRNSYINPSQSS